MASQLAHVPIPQSLRRQLAAFRRRLWAIKAIEAVSHAVFAIAVSYLILFVVDRLVDAPTWARVALFIAALAGCGFLPAYFVRWVWRRRRFDQLARLLSRRYPTIGDQMLGVIELVESDSEQARSRRLCEAAIQQVAEDAATRDFRDAVPNPHHRKWMALAAAPVALAVVLAVLYPLAAGNAWSRFLQPWQRIPRYTFTSVERLPGRLVVAHGEPFTLSIHLQKNSKWRPARATARLGSQPAASATLSDGAYSFEMPGIIQPAWMQLRIGDATQRVRVEPMLRPELAAVVADIQLPQYLQRSKPMQKDARGGAITVVNQSSVRFSLTANRGLSNAMLDDRPQVTSGAAFMTAPVTFDASRKLVFQWKDEFGLTGQQPFVVSVNATGDEAPTVACEDLPRQKVILDTETLNFKVRAQDDFGVKLVGLEWRGIDKNAESASAKGERVLAAGGSEKELLDVAGTFCARNLGIEPQPINVRLFAEDYLPGRARTYSGTYVLYVLSPEQHAIWIAEQMSKWHRQSLEVRDRELQLHHTNQQMRLLAIEELDRPETRRQIEAQSTAERANGRRLSGLVGAGEELVRQAMRNPEIGVGHLDKWAEMLQILKDISGKRMPNVADLLKQSSQAPGQQVADASQKPSDAQKPATQSNGGQSKPAAAHAGKSQPQPSGADASSRKEDEPKPTVPSVSDQESSQQPANNEEPTKDEPKNNSPPKLRLPVTTVAGAASKKPSQAPAGEKLDEAVAAQQDLLAEFEKVADELNKVLANLEGSTLVKRLKAASRKQYQIAGRISDQLTGSFGRPKSSATVPSAKALRELADAEMASSMDLSHIMDDMQAYFDRRRFQRFKNVLDEMRQQDPTGSLRQLSDDIPVESGMSIAQAEFWSDTLDRWADNLVDPGSSGKCPGCKSKGSLPPSVVLEAMQILEAEVNLREETRVAEQARAALTRDEHGTWAVKLQTTQKKLGERVAKLTERILDLPDAEHDFADEIKLLGMVESVMAEAADILGRPDTGLPAIAAETEAIELLLQSRRINPKGGGGGGSNPGGGGHGDTKDSALALIGTGVNDKEVREERNVAQAIGETGKNLPEEFRAGLDQYFNRLERDKDKP